MSTRLHILKSTIRFIFYCLISAIVVLGLLLAITINTPMHTKSSQVLIDVKPGASVRTFANELYSCGYVSTPLAIIVWAKLFNVTKSLQAGEYVIDHSLTPRQLLNKIITGDVMLREITIVNGWTFDQVRKSVADNDYLSHRLATLSRAQIMKKLGHPGENPEGRFYPDTYKFAKGTTDIEILTIAYNQMRGTLKKLWQNRAQGLAFKSPYQVLIVASMLEKETSKKQEYSQIAGVIVNRLRRRMYLQIDPTVIFGLGHRLRSPLTVRNLRTRTPYNTYTRKGLPPTPIAIPGYPALYGATHPIKSNNLFYVSKGDGSHVFTASLREHNKAVRKYLRKHRS